MGILSLPAKLVDFFCVYRVLKLIMSFLKFHLMTIHC